MHPFPFVVFYFWHRLIQALIIIMMVVTMRMMKVAIVLNTESSNSNGYLFGYLLGQQITIMLAEQKQSHSIS